MNDISVLNGWPIWCMAFLTISCVFINILFIVKHSFKSAELEDLNREDCIRSIKTGMQTAIGPSIATFVSAISLIIAVGSPFTFMRLNLTGSAPTLLAAAKFSADACGVEIGSAAYGPQEMATAWWIMTINACGWLIFTILFIPRMGVTLNKIGGGDAVLISVIAAAATTAVFSFQASQYLVQVFSDSPKAAACIVGLVVMLVLEPVSKKIPKVREYSLGIAIIAGVITGAIID